MERETVRNFGEEIVSTAVNAGAEFVDIVSLPVTDEVGRSVSATVGFVIVTGAIFALAAVRGGNVESRDE